MSALPKDALRRGWCPSTLRPMETGDGWLVRLHPPGARLTPLQLRRVAALAAEHGNGLIEISARANLQIRGVTAESHPKLVERLVAEGLVDEHDGDGPQRLTLVSPLAGPPRHSGASIDGIALAGQIEARARTIPDLPAKLCVLIDDGGTQTLGSFAGDLAITFRAGSVCLAGGLAGHLDHYLRQGGFMQRFLDKGVLSDTLRDVPVFSVEHGQLGLIGAAAWHAARHPAS